MFDNQTVTVEALMAVAAVPGVVLIALCALVFAQQSKVRVVLRTDGMELAEVVAEILMRIREAQPEGGGTGRCMPS